METNEKTLVDTFGNFIRNSVTLKLVIVFILMLMLMIPVSFIMELIRDRETLSQSAVEEVSGKWSGQQIVYGPVLTIPANSETIEEGTVKYVRENIHVLPTLLTVNGNVEPLTLNRGIYQVVVYNSEIAFRGTFEDMQSVIDNNPGKVLLWDEAFLTIHVSDLRGINERVVVNWGNQEFAVKPGTGIPDIIPSGFTVNNIFKGNPNEQEYGFDFKLNLQGSRHLGFVPLGKETQVDLVSDWAHPAFSGSFLPDERTVNNDGFKANYKILELNRNYPQLWVGNQHTWSIGDSAFGVDLILPVNDYQKAMRSAKYALLVIALTFLTFFLVEVFNKKSVHPFQYILIGLALVLFYTLLISLSEHVRFEIAYAIASISVIAMTGLYSRAVLGNTRQSIVLVSILFVCYAFVYFTLQVQDYALLLGSILLTLILAFTMYITRNIDWYDLSSSRTR